MNKFLTIISVLLILTGCAKVSTFTVIPDSGGNKIITGEFSVSLLESDSTFRWFGTEYLSYQPDKGTVDSISSAKKDCSYLIFLGTWCSDSKREVPRFFKIADVTGIERNRVMLYGVDRQKNGRGDLYRKYGIQRIPTIIVLKGSSEIGRIIEMPQNKLEIDLKEILSRYSH